MKKSECEFLKLGRNTSRTLPKKECQAPTFAIWCAKQFIKFISSSRKPTATGRKKQRDLKISVWRASCVVDYIPLSVSYRNENHPLTLPNLRAKTSFSERRTQYRPSFHTDPSFRRGMVVYRNPPLVSQYVQTIPVHLLRCR